jgi:hypothetical protein
MFQNKTNVETISFSRLDLKSGDVVRHDGKKIIDTGSMKRKQANKIGYTVELKLLQPPEEGSRLKIPKTILLYGGDMGRGTSRSTVKKVSAYIDRESEALDIRSGSGWTSIGIVCVLVGFFSFVGSVLLGQFSDPEPKRLRKIR